MTVKIDEQHKKTYSIGLDEASIHKILAYQLAEAVGIQLSDENISYSVNIQSTGEKVRASVRITETLVDQNGDIFSDFKKTFGDVFGQRDG